MSQAHEILFDEISRLPFEKVGKALSFVRYLEKEAEAELLLDPAEESELHELRVSGDFVSSSDILAKIKGLSE